MERNPKTEAKDKCKEIVEMSLRKVHHELRVNRAQINDLAFKQMVLKKEIKELHELRKTLKTV